MIISIICSAILLSMSSQLAYADFYKYNKKDTTFYISSGQANIKANELVYCQPISGCPTDHKLSQLIWDSRDVTMLIAGLSIDSGKSSFINIEGKFGVNEGDSVMDDYDWMYTNLDWSHWSHHEDTSVKESTALDINVGTHIYTKKETKLSVLFGYRKETWAWEGRGGTYIYSTVPTDYRDLSGSFTPGLPVIFYKQEFSMPYIGLRYKTQLDKWKFSLQYDYSNQVNVEAIDYHYLGSLIFKDDYDTGTMSAYKIGIGYQLYKNFDIFLRYDVQQYNEVRGNTTYIDSNTGGTLGGCSNCAGADNSNQILSIGVSFTY